MIRQDKRARRADQQALARRHPVALEHVDFLNQGRGRHDDTVTDQASDIAAQNARGNQVQHGFNAVDDHRMPGIVTALKAHDRVNLVGEHVDDFAFALVTPLRADNNDRPTHVIVLD